MKHRLYGLEHTDWQARGPYVYRPLCTRHCIPQRHQLNNLCNIENPQPRRAYLALSWFYYTFFAAAPTLD